MYRNYTNCITINTICIVDAYNQNKCISRAKASKTGKKGGFQKNHKKIEVGTGFAVQYQRSEKLKKALIIKTFVTDYTKKKKYILSIIMSKDMKKGREEK